MQTVHPLFSYTCASTQPADKAVEHLIKVIFFILEKKGLSLAQAFGKRLDGTKWV